MSVTDAGRALRPLHIDYDAPLEGELADLERAVSALSLPATMAPRWVAIKLLEEEPATVATIERLDGGHEIVTAALAAGERVRTATGEPPAFVIADRRFTWAHRVATDAIARDMSARSRSERFDDLFTSRWLGIPIFLGLMWVVFKVVTDVAGPFVDWVDGVVAGPVSSLAGAALVVAGLGGTWFEALVVDGIIGGVGAVLVFVPILVLLYAALGLLEDSGYMARAAFLMDHVMRPIGLNGKAFLPLLLGFGCNVPGVYATRLLANRRERIMTSLLLPFVTCAARLPIYILLAAAFFPSARGTVVFVMYVASIVVMLVVGAVLDRMMLRGQPRGSFVLELPPYRRPSLRVLWSYVSVRVRAFVAKAGTVIFACAVAIWLLLAVPVTGDGSFADTDLEDSAFAGTARVTAPALAPAGLGSWEISGTLVSGFVAKEVVVSTLEQVYDHGEEPDADVGHDPLGDIAASVRGLGIAVRDATVALGGIVGLGGGGEGEASAVESTLVTAFDETSGGHGGLAAAAFLAFTLLYVPCMATVGAIRHELGTRWAVASVAINLGVAWLAAVAVFQVGRALGIG